MTEPSEQLSLEQTLVDVDDELTWDEWFRSLPLAHVAARIRSHKGDEQTREPIGDHGDAPQLERHAQTRPLLVVELDRPARSDRLERLDDRGAACIASELLEQRVSFVPGDLDGLTGYVDSDAVEPAGHARRTYRGAA